MKIVIPIVFYCKGGVERVISVLLHNSRRFGDSGRLRYHTLPLDTRDGYDRGVLIARPAIPNLRFHDIKMLMTRGLHNLNIWSDL